MSDDDTIEPILPFMDPAFRFTERLAYIYDLSVGDWQYDPKDSRVEDGYRKGLADAYDILVGKSVFAGHEYNAAVAKQDPKTVHAVLVLDHLLNGGEVRMNGVTPYILEDGVLVNPNIKSPFTKRSAIELNHFLESKWEIVSP